jgi:hypothetical protein
VFGIVFEKSWNSLSYLMLMFMEQNYKNCRNSTRNVVHWDCWVSLPSQNTVEVMEATWTIVLSWKKFQGPLEQLV